MSTTPPSKVRRLSFSVVMGMAFPRGNGTDGRLWPHQEWYVVGSRRPLMATKTLEKLSKSELYERAQAADVPGRSQMDKDELIEALSDGGHEPKSKPSTSKRSIWNGAITFGLITIPVGLYTA